MGKIQCYKCGYDGEGTFKTISKSKWICQKCYQIDELSELKSKLTEAENDIKILKSDLKDIANKLEMDTSEDFTLDDILIEIDTLLETETKLKDMECCGNCGIHPSKMTAECYLVRMNGCRWCENWVSDGMSNQERKI